MRARKQLEKQKSPNITQIVPTERSERGQLWATGVCGKGGQIHIERRGGYARYIDGDDSWIRLAPFTTQARPESSSHTPSQRKT